MNHTLHMANFVHIAKCLAKGAYSMHIYGQDFLVNFSSGLYDTSVHSIEMTIKCSHK